MIPLSDLDKSINSTTKTEFRGDKLAYIKKTVQAGRTIETKYYHASRYGVHTPREAHKDITPEKVKEINIRNDVEKVTHRLNCNFIQGDPYITCTFKKELRPKNEDEAKEIYQKLLRDLRTEFKRIGQKLKYIGSIGIGKLGAVHFHLVINYIDSRVIQKLWPYGTVCIKPLDDTGNYAKLAEYLVKDGVKNRKGKYRKAYTTSRNLKKPVVKREVIHSRKWRDKPPKPPKGYYLEKESYYNGISDYDGRPVQFCRFIRLSRKDE